MGVPLRFIFERTIKGNYQLFISRVHQVLCISKKTVRTKAVRHSTDLRVITDAVEAVYNPT
jgi:hypothetical protein